MRRAADCSEHRQAAELLTFLGDSGELNSSVASNYSMNERAPI
jgi:hypothetical protein